MTNYKYSTTIGEKDVAAVGITLPISTKQSIEICAAIRGKKLERAKVVLSNAINEVEAIPFKRFTDGVGHRKGKMTNGRYPKKACTQILALVNSAQANAQFKGLNSADLIVRHISAQKGPNTPRYGRRRRLAKRTTIEVVLTETEVKKKEDKKVEKKDVPKSELKDSDKVKPKDSPKVEVKKEEPKSESKDLPKAQEKKPEEAKAEQ